MTDPWDMPEWDDPTANSAVFEPRMRRRPEDTENRRITPSQELHQLQQGSLKQPAAWPMPNDLIPTEGQELPQTEQLEDALAPSWRVLLDHREETE